MQQTEKRSKAVAVFQTALFLAVIVGIIAAAVVFGPQRAGSDQSKGKTYRRLEISTLADYDYKEPPIIAGEDKIDASKSTIPEKILALNGAKVSVTGYMMPVQVDGEGYVAEFALNGNYDMCFYGAPSRINQWVHVRMKEGVRAKFSHKPTTVVGTFEVGEIVENGVVVSLYRLDGDRADPPPAKLF